MTEMAARRFQKGGIGFLRRLGKILLGKKFIGFCAIGIVNIFNTAFFSWLSHHIMQENVAANLGYAVSLTVNYILNSLTVFKKPLSFKRYFRFIISYLPNFLIYFLVTLLTINTLRLPQFWGTVLAAMAGGPITFIILKLYAFGNKADER